MEIRNLNVVGFGTYLPDANYTATEALLDLMNAKIAKVNEGREEKLAPIILKPGKLIKRQEDAEKSPDFFAVVHETLKENRIGLKIEPVGDGRFSYSFNGTDALTPELAAIFNRFKEEGVPEVRAGMGVHEMTGPQCNTFQKVLGAHHKALDYRLTLGGSVPNARYTYEALLGEKGAETVNFTHIPSSTKDSLGTVGALPKKFELKSAKRVDRTEPFSGPEKKDIGSADIVMAPQSSLKFREFMQYIQDNRKEGSVLLLTLHGDSATKNPDFLDYADIIVGNVEQYERFPGLIENHPKKDKAVFIITDGKNGLYMVHNGKCKHFPTMVLGCDEFVSALGARDAVTGAGLLLATMMLCDPEWEKNLDNVGKIANAAAAAACRVLETALPEGQRPYIDARAAGAPDGGPWKEHHSFAADAANAAAYELCKIEGTILSTSQQKDILTTREKIAAYREGPEGKGRVSYDSVRGIIPPTCECC